jgi:hypothetical protein
VHGSLLNEDLIQPKKLEMGISHRTGGRTGHFDWGRHETTPEWSATRKLSRSGVLGSERRAFWKDGDKLGNCPPSGAFLLDRRVAQTLVGCRSLRF